MLRGWRPLAEVAREAAAREGCTARTIRNRLLAVNAAAGGGVLRSLERSGPVRKWWVNPAKLEQALRSDPEKRSADLEELESRVERLEQQHTAMRRAVRALRRQVAELERAGAAKAAPPDAGADERAWREAG